MADLFSSGRIVDLILGLMVLETAVLAGHHKLMGRGIPTSSLLTNMAAGACLLAALRAALTGAEWSVTAGALAAALVMHLLDLRSRWNR
jgi:hypothetical protein